MSSEFVHQLTTRGFRLEYLDDCFGIMVERPGEGQQPVKVDELDFRQYEEEMDGVMLTDAEFDSFVESLLTGNTDPSAALKQARDQALASQ